MIKSYWTFIIARVIELKPRVPVPSHIHSSPVGVTNRIFIFCMDLFCIGRHPMIDDVFFSPKYKGLSFV